MLSEIQKAGLFLFSFIFVLILKQIDDFHEKRNKKWFY